VRDAREAAAWAARALSSSGCRADFSLESLREIDRFFDEQAPDGEPVPKGLLADGPGPWLFAIGAYIGEVIRRQGGGFWVGDDDDPAAGLKLALRLGDGSIIWPMQRAVKRCKLGSEEGIYAYGYFTLKRE
jgi:hypothetical protein